MFPLLKRITRNKIGPLLPAIACSLGAVACGGSGPTSEPLNVPASQLPPYRGGYRLPVEGDWKVFRTHYKNTKDQSSAVDLIVDAPRPGRGAPNAEYPSYGKPILADGPGVISIVVDGVPDNDPGTSNGYDAHGNYVVIDHRNGEFSLFAHLIPGSIQVKRGQVVGMGMILGLCGNSGHSSMPHLHWQIMNHPFAHVARGVPVRHMRYERNGQPSGARLEKNDRVRATDL